MTTKQSTKQPQAQHTPNFETAEVAEALARFIKTGSADGNEPLRMYCYRHVKEFAAAPETAAERDRLKAINSELLAALKMIATPSFEDARCDFPDWEIARAAIAKAEGGAP